MIAIAIDGPAASGKSTVASAIAKELGFCHLDSGAMYRGVAYAAIKRGIEIAEDNPEFKEFINNMNMEIIFSNGQQLIYVDDEDVTPHLREPQTAIGSAKVAQVSYVRKTLVELQQIFAKTNNVVMDGRDIGTAVLPNTPYKFFVTADIKERARRRQAQQQERTIEEIEKEIEQRDFEDENRAVSPLIKAADAILIDNTQMSQQQTIDEILKRIPNEFL